MSKVERFYRNLRSNYRNTNWWRTVVAELGIQPAHALLSVQGDGIDVMAADWDTLIVLDACRADLFADVADMDAFDEYDVVTSAGSMTAEWTTKNFAGRRFDDTVYVTANPFTTKLAGESFYRLQEVWREAFDEERRTVLPEAVADATREAHEEFPEKRLVVHFMQPHFPFVRSEALQFTGWDDAEILDDQPRSGRPSDPWDALEMGVATREEVYAAYADNLQYALESVYDLLSDLDGRTVVTSDHGNLLGERAWPIPIKLYGHPKGVRHPDLVRVPWAVAENGARRRIVAGDPEDAAEYDTEELNERLRQLGYNE